jgi:hypothetical protein
MEFYFKGPQANIWSGDSVAFNADTFIENDASEPIVSTAIPGDNTKTFLARIDNNILKIPTKESNCFIFLAMTFLVARILMTP